MVKYKYRTVPLEQQQFTIQCSNSSAKFFDDYQ